MQDQEIILQVGVKVLLKNSDGNYLLMRSNPEKYPEKGGRWDIVGGRINPGTTLLENLRREVKEEANLDLIEIPKLVAAQDILRMPGRHVVRLTYIGSISGQPQMDEESMEWKWFSAEEITTLPVENLDIYVKELIDSGILVLNTSRGKL